MINGTCVLTEIKVVSIQQIPEDSKPKKPAINADAEAANIGNSVGE